MKKFTLLFSLLTLLLAASSTYAQDLRGNNWFFGNSKEAIRFNKSDKNPSLLKNQAVPFGTGGSAVATNPVDGALLFYTDGEVVYDASHRQMPGGSGLGANTSINQPVAISPVPGMPGQYYIFSNNPERLPNPLINASVVDMNLPGNASAGEPPLGEVISTELTNIVSNFEAMTVISDLENGSSWLVSQAGTTVLFAEISDSPPFNNIPNSIIDPYLQAGNFVFNAEKNLLAIVPGNANANIKIYSFNVADGSFTVLDTIQNSAKTGELLYDAAWSTDGNILYFSRSGTGGPKTGQLYQYYADSVAPQPVLDTPVQNSYGLQMGPDGKLYHLYQEDAGGPFRIGRVEDPNTIDTLNYSTWQQNININGKQFPQFTPQETFEFTLVNFEVVDTCANSRTKFIPHVTPGYDSLVWAIADTIINGISPELAFEQGGLLPVSMTAFLNGHDSTFTDTIEIIDNQLQISLPSSDTTVCASAFPGFTLEATLQMADGSQVPPGTQVFWSNNPNSPSTTGTFDSTGTYYAVAQGQNGCAVYASVQIRICQEEKRVGNIWFFGDKAGIDFNPEEPVALPDSSEMIAPEGASAISDRNGQILFYTNGSTVWNKEGNIMVNGTNIGGDSLATQSALVVPFPGDATRYYIFTTDVTHGDLTYDLRYSIVDIKGDNTRGIVEPTSKGSILFNKSTEKITAVEKGDTTWLLVHEFGNDVFRAYPISSGGIGQVQINSIGSDHTSGKGYMKFSTDGSKVAAAVQGPPGFVELFNFNDSTGSLSDELKLDFASEPPYGVEFSPDNEKLYVSTGSALYQYHISDSLTNEEILASKKEISVNASGPLGALQIGPNGQIYLAQDGAGEVLVINGPNTLETDTSHVAVSPFSLEGPTSQRGLPNFVQSLMEPISEGDFTFANQCVGDEVQFTAVERCNTDLFQWSISKDGDPVALPAAARNPSRNNMELFHTFTTPGTYIVSLTISNPCAVPQDTTITKPVEIYAPPAAPEFASLIGICQGDTLLTAGPVADSLAYSWSTGDSTNAITVSEPGIYTVTITNTITGCSTDYTTELESSVPEAALGPDLIFCQGEVADTLKAGSGGNTYAWTINNVPTSTTSSRQMIDTSVPGEFWYKVVKTGVFGCETSDSVLVTINSRPNFSATPTPTSNCGINDGAITLTNNGEAGNYSFQWSNGETTQDISGLEAGLYNVTVTDETTGCTQNINGLEVSDGNADFTIVNSSTTNASCGTANGTITIELSSDVFPIEYVLLDESGNVYTLGNNIDENSTQFIIPGIQAGSYTIEVTSLSGCVQTLSNIEVPEPDQVDLQVEDFIEACGSETFIIASSNTNSGVTFNWTGPAGSFTGATDGATVGVNQSGIYTVTASYAGFCDSVRQVAVELTSPPTASITQTGDNCDGEVTLTAVDETDNSGNSYQWTRNGQVVGRSRSIAVRESGTYEVEIARPGCSDVASLNIEVFERPVLDMTYDAACSPEEPFTLFANATPAAVRYTWFYPNGNVIPGTGKDSVVVRDEGTYRVEVQNGSCITEGSITVARNEVGRSFLPEKEVIICPSSADPKRSEVYLNPDSLNSFILFRWEVDEQFISSERIIKPVIPGLYRVTMTNTEGCIIEDEVRVVLSCKPVLFVPNAIRPGSGISPNRTFRIFTEDGISDDGFQVYIFNRWGELIFQSKDKNFEWDGTFNGNPVPVGTYSYTIYYKGAEDPSGEVFQLQGGVTVLR